MIYMLNKKDLSQIQKIVRTETKVIVKEETGKVIKKELAPLKKDIKIIKENVNMVIDHFDVEVLSLKGRVEKIEDHLGFITSPA